MTTRGYSNHNETGNSRDRRRRKQWLLDEFGDGEFVACFRQISTKCLYVLDFQTLTVDRIVSRSAGGRYTRDNIQPACGSCNSVAGNLVRWGRGR